MTVSPFSSLTPNEPFPCLAIARTVTLRCELVRGTEAGVLEQLLPLIQEQSITLDLSQVERIDAAGIAALITLYCTAVESHTQFTVTAPSSRVLELLRLVGLEPMLVAAGPETKQPQHRSQPAYSAA